MVYKAGFHTTWIYSGWNGRQRRKDGRKILAEILVDKCLIEYLEMVGFVQVRMSLAVVRSNNLLIRGYQGD